MGGGGGGVREGTQVVGRRSDGNLPSPSSFVFSCSHPGRRSGSLARGAHLSLAWPKTWSAWEKYERRGRSWLAMLKLIVYANFT